MDALRDVVKSSMQMSRYHAVLVETNMLEKSRPGFPSAFFGGQLSRARHCLYIGRVS